MADKYWNGNTGTDGDVTDATNWTPSGVPTASDNVRLVAGFNTAMSSNLAGLSGVSLGDFIVEEGYTGTIGTSTADLEITCTSFEFEGSGKAYIDLEASNITATIHGSAASTSVGTFGLYLIGSNLAALVVSSGSVALAGFMGTTATAAAVRVSGGTVTLGAGCTVTTVTTYGGTINTRANITTANGYGGTLRTGEQAAITTLLVDGASVDDRATGTITTATVNSGYLAVKAGTSKTISTLNINAGGGASWDPNSVTVSALVVGDDDVPIKVNTSRG